MIRVHSRIPARARRGVSTHRRLMVLALAGASALILTGCVVTTVLPAMGWIAMGVGALLLLAGCDILGGDSGGGKKSDPAPVINLGDLAAASGFVLTGEAAGDRAGYSVAGDGDGNGDGKSDALIGAPQADEAYGYDQGRVYVIEGDSGLSGTAGLGDVGASVSGVVISNNFCGGSDELTGYSLGWLGDSGIYGLSSDGNDEIGIVAPGESLSGSVGACFVLGGSASLTDTNLAYGGYDLVIYDAGGSEPSGLIIGNVPNFAGTGDPAIVVGDSGRNSDAGELFVISDHTSNSNIDLGGGSIFDRGLVVTNGGSEPGALLGASFDVLGDLGGDAKDDIIVGAPGANQGGTDRGAAYVVFGRTLASGWTTSNVASLGSKGFVISGSTNNDRLGQSVAGIDWNADGVPDMAIGAPGNGSGTGNLYVIFGVDGSTSDVAVGDLTADEGFVVAGESAGDRFGFTVANVGDLDGDDVDDLAVAAPTTDNEAGRIYILFGGSDLGDEGSADVADLKVEQGVILTGESGGDQAGRSLAAGGDVDGDGVADLLVGAPYESTGGADAGAVYILFGIEEP